MQICLISQLKIQPRFIICCVRVFRSLAASILSFVIEEEGAVESREQHVEGDFSSNSQDYFLTWLVVVLVSDSKRRVQEVSAPGTWPFTVWMTGLYKIRN